MPTSFGCCGGIQSYCTSKDTPKAYIYVPASFHLNNCRSLMDQLKKKLIVFNNAEQTVVFYAEDV